MTRKDNALCVAFAVLFTVYCVVLFMVFCVTTAHCSDDNPCFLPEGCTQASSASTPEITEAFTAQGNYVMVLMPDPNASEPFVIIRLCEGNVIDQTDNACHDAIPFSEPEGLRRTTHDTEPR